MSEEISRDMSNGKRGKTGIGAVAGAASGAVIGGVLAV